jgi:hypothetical protein
MMDAIYHKALNDTTAGAAAPKTLQIVQASDSFNSLTSFLAELVKFRFG